LIYCVKGYKITTKIMWIGVFMSEIWVFEVRVSNLCLLSLFCEYVELYKSFWRSGSGVWKLTWWATFCVKILINSSLGRGRRSYLKWKHQNWGCKWALFHGGGGLSHILSSWANFWLRLGMKVDIYVKKSHLKSLDVWMFGFWVMVDIVHQFLRLG